MTVLHSHNDPSPGPSCVIVTIEMTYYFNFFCVVLLVLFATSGTNIDPLQVLSTMAPKHDRVYECGQSKSVAPSASLVIPKKVAFGVVTASQSYEERTLTDTPFGSATNEEGVSGSLGV